MKRAGRQPQRGEQQQQRIYPQQRAAGPVVPLVLDSFRLPGLGRSRPLGVDAGLGVRRAGIEEGAAVAHQQGQQQPQRQ